MKKLPNTPSLLTAHQKSIFDEIITAIESKVGTFLNSGKPEDYMLSLMGAAGTGKTFLTTQIAKYLLEKQKQLSHPEELKYHFVVTAPTHKAVSVLANLMFEQKMQVSCKTIHSFLAIKPFIDYETGEERFMVDKTKSGKDVTSILIVDESSMIGSELYSFIKESILDGHIKLVLFIGDPYQLLPVNDNANKVYELNQTFKLKEVVRQAKESPIIQIATDLREAIASQEFGDLRDFFEAYANKDSDIGYLHNREDFLNEFYVKANWHEEEKILATYKNKDVDAFNSAIRAKYWEEREILNPPTLLPGDKLRFKEMYGVGDVTLYNNSQVVTLKKAEKMYHNDLGIEYWECRDIDAPKQQIFRVVDPDSLKTFNEKLDIIAKKAKASDYPHNRKMWKLFYDVRAMFAQVQYVHASTIHKLQGSTYETVYIDLFSLLGNGYMSMDEKYRLVYVAVTRASHQLRIFLPAFGTTYTVDASTGQEINMIERFADIDEMIEKISF